MDNLQKRRAKMMQLKTTPKEVALNMHRQVPGIIYVIKYMEPEYRNLTEEYRKLISEMGEDDSIEDIHVMEKEEEDKIIKKTREKITKDDELKKRYIEAKADYYEIFRKDGYYTELVNNAEFWNLAICKKRKKVDCDNYLFGPCAMSLFCLNDDYCNKNILLFGERHDSHKDNCNIPGENISGVYSGPFRICNKLPPNNTNILIHDFIYKLIESASKKNICVDLFLEKAMENTSYDIYEPRKNLEGGGSYQGDDTVRSLGKMILSIEKFKKHDNVRVHDFDLRGDSRHWVEKYQYFEDDMIKREGIKNGVGIGAILGILSETMGHKPTKHLTHDEYRKFLEYLTGKINLDNDLINIIDNIYRFTPPLEQVDIIKRKVIFNELRYVRNKINKEYTKYEVSKCKLGQNLRDSFIDLFVDGYVNGSCAWQMKNEIDISLVITDLYNISRMFMNFDTNPEKIDRAPKICRSDKHNTPQYIIVYCGDTHRQLYEKMIKDAIDKEADVVYNTKSSNRDDLVGIPINELSFKGRSIDSYLELIDIFLGPSVQ